MREIKFRAKRLDNHQWIFGSLVIREQDIHGTLGYFISTPNGEWIQIHKSTVGQYTGLKDKNEKEIYEGDILTVKSKVDIKYRAIPSLGWSDDGYYSWHWITYYQGKGQINNYSITAVDKVNERYEVIGNIFEDPELLK